MPKMATKAADNVFYKARIAAASWNDRLGSREGASEVTGIDRTRLANIELGTINPHPEEVLMLSDTYNAPELQNHFCSHLCPLGIGTISPIELEELERVTLQLISAMKSLPEVKDGIIDIAADGVIDAKEKPRMEQYDYTCSIEKVKTRIKLLSKEDKVLAEKADTELEKTIGIMQDISTPDSNTEEANLTDMAESMLAEQKLPSKTLTIEGLGQANVISGVGLCIIIRPLGISNSYYVDEDTHTFKGNYHSMRLTLNMATDTERSAKASDEKSSTSHSVGDKVQFSGGPQYVASTATSPTNSPKAGPAKITAIAKSKNAKHPYHIIHTDKQSTVYGWVDASQIG